MKTHELASHLELLVKLLRSLPNADLDESFASELQSSYDRMARAATKERGRSQQPLPPGLEAKLAGKSPAEIEQILSSEDEAFTTAQLSELADRLGIPASRRQSKVALINLITRHFEARQMHSMIGNARSDET